jgi:hypothetical protein
LLTRGPTDRGEYRQAAGAVAAGRKVQTAKPPGMIKPAALPYRPNDFRAVGVVEPELHDSSRIASNKTTGPTVQSLHPRIIAP